ncbi:MAG: ATP phosphoribosyltransferase [Candidatus Marinamargulisbacteria bacterium]|jgi:ATP phosphoribosyltransferase
MTERKGPKTVITIAASKGYLLKETLALFKKVGIFFEKDILETRRLFAYDKSKTIKLLLIRPWDVPVYVEQGAADIGIAGLDTVLEQGSNVLKLLDLYFGACRLIIAGPKGAKESPLKHNITVATKYPHSAEQFFQKKGLKVNLIKLYGAIELAPLTGLSDVICDLTASGKTLEENNLKILESVFESSAILIANPVAIKFKYETISNLVADLKKNLKK